MPNSKTNAVIINPLTPVSIPNITIIPSLPNIPNDINKMPNDGKRFVKGKGNAIANEKIRAKKPITLAPPFWVMLSNLCLNTFSILFIIGELLIISRAINDRLIVFFKIHLGSHGYFMPINN